MKQLPYEFELKKEPLFYPSKPNTFEGDILEIGPGRGDLLLAMAASLPHKKFVAIEIGKKRYGRLIPRIEKRGIKNILLIGGDARLVLPKNFSGETFETIWVLFPDPWPKKRHIFRRLLTLEFLWLLTHQLKPGGNLIIATDVGSYAAMVSDNLQQIPPLSNTLSPLPFASSLPELPQTFFEQKWRDEGRGIFFLKYGKKGVLANECSPRQAAGNLQLTTTRKEDGRRKLGKQGPDLLEQVIGIVGLLYHFTRPHLQGRLDHSHIKNAA